MTSTHARTAVSEPRSLAGIRVLVVDDDRDMCDALQQCLGTCGAEVIAATSTAEALAALDRSRPDVLLSDLAMPDGSGYDLMREIAAREGRNAPPAAAFSAYAMSTDRRQAREAGFRMLIGKPVELEVLIEVVANLASRKHTKRPRP